MFFKKRKPPTIREFTMEQLRSCQILSDEEIMDRFGDKYMRGYSYSSIGKKCESIRKYLYSMTKEGTLQEVSRNIRKDGSHEIFYSQA